MASGVTPAAVSFDIVGTLLFPHPSVGRIYARVARQAGHTVDAAVLDRRFATALRSTQPGLAARARWDEVVERTFAGEIPASALRAVREGCWHAFAQGEAWRTARGALVTLAQVRFLGLRTGALSNADERMRGVLEAKGLLALLDAVHLSTPGAEPKPHPAAFAAMASALGCETRRLVHVGDELEADARGAVAAGATGVWLDARPAPDDVRGLSRLTALPELVRGMLMPGQAARRLPRRHRNLLANLRGMPEETGRSSEREIRTLDQAVEEAVRRLGVDRPVPEHAISAAWPSLLPAPLARRTAPLRILPDGKLMIQCEGATVRSEAAFHSRALVAKVRALPGCGHVNAVGFVVA